MIIRCIDNEIANVCTENLAEALEHIYGSLKRKDEGLVPGLFHVVYSVFDAGGIPWYLIKNNDRLWYPLWYPACFFEVIDPTHSRLWIRTRQDGVGRAPGPGLLYSFPEYTEMDCFYYNLVDACEEEVKVFERCIKEIRDEAIL